MSNDKPSPETIAARLRECDTVPDGEEYLDGLGLTLDEMREVAPCLRLTRFQQFTKKDLRARLLHQAIGARRKYDGLRDGW